MPNRTSPLSQISLPDVLGWEWIDEYEGFEGQYRHQISWSRGSRTFLYGTKAPGGQWVNVTVDDPERLGFDGTAAGALKVAQAFHTREGD